MDFIFFLLFIAVVIAVPVAIVFVLISPFHYPYDEIFFDVSGKRLPKMEDHIDMYLIGGGIFAIEAHERSILNWKEDCQRRIDRSFFKKLRTRQYRRCIDDGNAYVFIFTRTHTRYRQSNYVRTPYYVSQETDRFTCNIGYLRERDKKLAEINYECTLRQYRESEQRKNMTPKLRRQVILRDGFTCQICGKYMPDEVGLEIDHIVPISKGGKSVPSNLQVLCSKCNRRKSNRML